MFGRVFGRAPAPAAPAAPAAPVRSLAETIEDADKRGAHMQAKVRLCLDSDARTAPAPAPSVHASGA